jgi:hypothetical protein
MWETAFSFFFTRDRIFDTIQLDSAKKMDICTNIIRRSGYVWNCRIYRRSTGSAYFAGWTGETGVQRI